MNSNTEDQPKAGLSGPGNPVFDPAVWLDRAERCGYRIYLSGATKGGRLRIVTEAPCRPKSADDMALWHEFQGRPQRSRANRAALIAYLVKTGRFGQRAAEGGNPSEPDVTGAQRSRPNTAR